MQLTAATPTAPTPAPADLLSLIPTLGMAPGASTDLSSPIAQDFSALLTEMMGPGAMPAPALPQVPAPAQVDPAQTVQPAEPVELPAIGEIVPGEQAAATQKPQDAQKPQKIEDVPTQSVLIPFVSSVCSAVTSPLSKDGKAPRIDDEPAETKNPAATVPTVPQPELERAFAEIRKFELKVEQEARPQQPQALAAPAEALKEALVTTDPIANIQQQQLPPRVLAIQKIVSEAKQAERGKTAPTTDSSDETKTTATGAHFSAAAQTVEYIEQVRAAHQVEIPDLPKLQVVRTVAMQVGDDGSQVTIHIQERGGDVTLQLNTGNEPLHQDLQASVGSLLNALKLERVQVSNVEVSRKSPVDKVRRMKETR